MQKEEHEHQHKNEIVIEPFSEKGARHEGPGPLPLEQTWLIDDIMTPTQTTQRVPTMPAALPRTVTALLHEWEELRLGRLENSNKSEWQAKTRQQYSKRLYLFRRILRNAERYHDNMDNRDKLFRAAYELDQERGGRTLAAYYKALKAMDPATRRRRSRRRRRDGENL